MCRHRQQCQPHNQQYYQQCYHQQCYHYYQQYYQHHHDNQQCQHHQHHQHHQHQHHQHQDYQQCQTNSHGDVFTDVKEYECENKDKVPCRLTTSSLKVPKEKSKGHKLNGKIYNINFIQKKEQEQEQEKEQEKEQEM